MKLHEFKDKEYWRKRWAECFPYTYPPELFDYRWVTKKAGWWIFTYDHSYMVTVCARCNERISTGHYCKDLWERE